MLTLTAITALVFALGYWSAYMRIIQVGGEALPVSSKVIMAVLGLVCAAGAACLITSPGLGVLMAEFLVLCTGQTLGYILSGKSKKV